MRNSCRGLEEALKSFPKFVYFCLLKKCSKLITCSYTDRKNNGLWFQKYGFKLLFFFKQILYNSQCKDVHCHIAAHSVFLNLLCVHQSVKSRAVTFS